MQLKAVLFDLDDTLHDKSATLRAVSNSQYLAASLARLGVDEHAWQESFVELNNLRIEKSEVFARLAKSFALPPVLQASLLEDFDNNLGKLAVPFPGAVDLLQACKGRGLKTAIVTNGRDAFQRSKIAGMGLTALVDAVATSGAFGSKKPDLAIFHYCLDALKVEPGEAAFVGDDLEADIEPAVAIGMRAIWKSTQTSQIAWLCSDSLPLISTALGLTS
jgi:putative hydrolase of the HAD superfamily